MLAVRKNTASDFGIFSLLKYTSYVASNIEVPICSSCLTCISFSHLSYPFRGSTASYMHAAVFSMLLSADKYLNMSSLVILNI